MVLQGIPKNIIDLYCAIICCNIVACRKPDVSVIGEEVTIVSKWPGKNSHLDDGPQITFCSLHFVLKEHEIFLLKKKLTYVPRYNISIALPEKSFRLNAHIMSHYHCMFYLSLENSSRKIRALIG